MRAELHRRSIAQMRVSYYLTHWLEIWIIHITQIWEFIIELQINNRSIQDLHIFGDPSRIPIVIVERVVNAPIRSTIGNSSFSLLDQKDTNALIAGVDSNPSNKLSGTTRQSGRTLKIVVFVHGFQACFMMLLTYLIPSFAILYLYVLTYFCEFSTTNCNSLVLDLPIT